MIWRVTPMSRRGDVTFHADGRIDLTAQVSEQLYLSEGDILDIGVSDTPVREYYLFVAHRADATQGRHTCRCHAVNGKGRYMRMFSKSLCSFMLQAARAEGKVTFRAGETRTLPGLGHSLTLVAPVPPVSQPQCAISL